MMGKGFAFYINVILFLCFFFFFPKLLIHKGTDMLKVYVSIIQLLFVY